MTLAPTSPDAQRIYAAALAFNRDLAEIGLEHQVDDALVGRIAILKGDLLGEDLDLGDRLGRQVAHLAKTADAAPVDEDDRPTTATPAPRARLRRERTLERVHGHAL